MNYRILFSVLGLLVVLQAGLLFCFALVAGIVYPEEAQAQAFVIAALFSLSFGGLARLIAGRLSNDDNVTFREALSIAALGWVVFALFGALPFYFSDVIPSFTDSYFESISGYTTTGASVLTTIADKGHAILLWRSFTQWVGGMGIIVLYIAIFPALGMGAIRMFRAEAPGPSPDKLVPRIRENARILYTLYVFFSMVLAVMLMAGGMNLFETLCHTFSTMSTGGFSPLNGSIGEYQNSPTSNSFYFELCIIFFMFLASTNFSLHYQVMRGDFKAYRDPEFRIYLALVLLVVVLVAADLLVHGIYGSPGEALRHSAFSTVSVITTTGFATVDYDTWSSLSRALLFILMFTGGMAGSTSGGIKIVRIMALVQESLKEIQNTIHPSKVYTVRFGEVHLSREVLRSIHSFVVIFAILYLVGIAILATTNLDLETISSMVIACLGNIGPGFGAVGPTQNYAEIEDFAKWILSYMMILGRLELFPVLALCLPRMWSR